MANALLQVVSIEQVNRERSAPNDILNGHIDLEQGRSTRCSRVKYCPWKYSAL